MSVRLSHWLKIPAFFATLSCGLLCGGDASAAAPLADDFNSGSLNAAWGDFLVFGNDVPHSATLKNGVLFLSGGGSQLQNYNSAEFLPQSEITGSFDIRLQVLSVPQCNARSEVGLMIRQDRNEDSVNWVEIGVTRSNANEMSSGSDTLSEDDSNVGKRTPQWLRLVSYPINDSERLIQGYISNNAHPQGSDGHLLRSIRIPMTDPVLVGPFLRTQCEDNSGIGSVDDFTTVPVPEGGILAVHAVYSGQTDSEGNPLPASSIRVSVQQNGKEVGAADTDSSGDAFVTGLPEGPLKVIPMSPRLAPLTVDAQSVKNEVTDLDVEVTTLPAVADLISNPTWESQFPAKNPKATPDEIAEAPSSDFTPITLPNPWNEGQPTGNQYGWYRAKVSLSAAIANPTDPTTKRDLLLTGFTIDNQDWTYWNGALIGAVNNPNGTRSYVIPADLLQEENNLVILAYNRGGIGGMTQAAPNLTQVNPTGRILVNLVDPQGKPYTGQASISAFAAGSDILSTGETSTQSNLGQAVLSGLPPGTYEIVTSPPDGSLGPTLENQVVTAGQTLTVQITLDASGSEVVPGDVNGDGKVTIADATFSLQLAVGNIDNPTDAQTQAGDVTHDGKVTIADTTKILQFVVGNLPSLD